MFEGADDRCVGHVCMHVQVNHTLTDLDIFRNNICDVGASALAECLKVPINHMHWM